MSSDLDFEKLLENVNQIAQAAGERIMEVYATDFEVEQKSDKSPLTTADMAAHQTIVTSLKEITPDLPVLSEESASISYQERAGWERYWLVDPLDGTREFIKRNGEFTVNIALIDNHKSILGVVYIPVTGTTYFAREGGGAFKCLRDQSPKPIEVRLCPKDSITVAGSRSHAGSSLKKFISELNTDVKLVSIGSSLKLCLVAEGKADIYPRFGPTSEWDIAAAHCVVEQAGGHLTDTQLQPLRYNTKESLLNPYFLVYGDTNKDWLPVVSKALSS
ncbi:3'(2'),5'-bisphosphate nucleotidase CysQ [Candidatus Parabeggiatoa sp. HSG14]|uniref:3'(2'),5'-bisphosphate nucleotidase CysQ n=1 Tax=Candidatus Parabeggiatoa sp. HSG14 TaxID=3055593 RepID=UPI0025A865F8|nr:3'(2'),5'-bisphosphate nucleotidase CysQ [Thiotrichales bacterium HSG14]